MTIRPYTDGDLEAVCRLWRDTGVSVPHNDPVRDIAFALQSPTAELFVGETAGALIATVLAGHDGHRGWLYYLAVAEVSRRSGYGRMMVEHAEAWLKNNGVWKINLMIRTSNTQVRDFYAAIGYQDDPVTVMSRRLETANKE